MTWRLAAKDQASRVELKRNPNFGTLPKLLVRMKNQTGAFVAPAHRSTLLHLLNTLNYPTKCSVMLPPSVQSIIPAEGVRCRGCGSMGRCPVRAQESKVRFADDPTGTR